MNTTAASAPVHTGPQFSADVFPDFIEHHLPPSTGLKILEMMDGGGALLPTNNCHREISLRLTDLSQEGNRNPLASVRCDHSFDLTQGVPQAMDDWLGEYDVGPITLAALVEFALSVSPEQVPSDLRIVPYGHGNSLMFHGAHDLLVPVLEPTRVGRWILGLDAAQSAVRRETIVLARSTRRPVSE